MYGLSPLLNKVFSKVLYLGRDSEGDIKTSQLRHQFESRKTSRLNALTWPVNPFELLFRHVQTNTKGSDAEVILYRSLKLFTFSVVIIVSMGDVWRIQARRALSRFGTVLSSQSSSIIWTHASSTRISQLVSRLSTIQAQCGLNSVFKWNLVQSSKAP